MKTIILTWCESIKARIRVQIGTQTKKLLWSKRPVSVLNFTPTQRRQRQYEVYLSPAKRRSMTLLRRGKNGARGQPLRALSTRRGILLIGVICYSAQCIAELNATSQRYFQTLCSSMRPRCSIVYCRSRRPCPVLSMAIVCSICYFCLHTPCAITLYH